MDLILNFEFVKLEKLFRDQIEARVGDPAPNLGILSMIRAFITKSELDFNLAIEELEDAQKKSELNFKDLTLKLYPAADLFTLKVYNYPMIQDSSPIIKTTRPS